MQPVVCVVDDDAAIRESLRFFFEDEEYEVEEAADGAAALALLRARARPRIMLLDRMMTRVDGVRTLRLLADEPELLRQTAIVFMTARSDPPDPGAAALVGRLTVATVSKPFDLDTLLVTVERAAEQLALRETVE